LKPRPRQNVILELGFFLGKLGRRAVVVLYVPEPNFDMPSDCSGVLYIQYNSGWKNKLAQELKDYGFNLNLDALLTI